MTAKHPTPLSHGIYLTDYVHGYQRYLDHEDPAVRLTGLRAIAEFVNSRIAQEYAAGRPRTTARPAHANWKRAIAEDIDARIAEPEQDGRCTITWLLSRVNSCLARLEAGIRRRLL